MGAPESHIRADQLTLEQVRARLGGAQGKEYWRSLSELSETEGFQELVEREFPRLADVWNGAPDRRRVLKFLGASLALAGLSGCAQAPPERIMPYVRQPEGVTPGRPLFFATAMPHAGYASGGLLVQSNLGRPTKIEGNPLHPASAPPEGSPPHAQFGPSDVYAQASVLGLYDPDRARSVTFLGDISSWDQFHSTLQERLRRLPADGTGLRILTETVTSPTLAHQIGLLLRRYPGARWHVQEPVSSDNARVAGIQAFGQEVETHYHFDRADVVLSLDADFLNEGPDHLRHARDFTNRRRAPLGEANRPRNRLYLVESCPSGTGALADHRIPLAAARIESFTRALAQRLNVPGAAPIEGPLHGVRAEWIQALADDLGRAGGRSAIVVGAGQPPMVHALAHAMNVALGNVGQTVTYLPPTQHRPANPTAGLADLTESMQGGRVSVLLILGGNPVYTAPADIAFAQALAQVGLRVHLSLYADETSSFCHWHLPEAHYLESWGDVRTLDGTVSLIQPLIAPLYGGRTISEVVAALTGQSEQTGHEIVRAYWRSRGLPGAAGDFERAWERALHDGFIGGSQSRALEVRLQNNWAAAPRSPEPAPGLEIVFKPDPTIYDGRYANNGWLQELPKPLSKVTWDNAAYMSPATAVRLELAPSLERAAEATEQVVELELHGRTVTAPVYVQPGHADDSITVHLGHGRTRGGRLGTRVGFNAYALRTAAAPAFATGLTLRRLDRRHQLATTQHHHLMENRDLVREGTFQSPPRIPEGAQAPRQLISLYPEYRYEGNKWGMAIDLSVCSGCSACVVACQAENNIPVVGKDQVQRGRELHWLRIDSYYKGDRENPKIFFQPVPCMHCENAPCEVVCPVMATAHSSDGLNDMVYNRCVGTRYCSNNCPYKVRRFNFLQYADFTTPSIQLQRNPEVTIRSRGVMEKCTYCVQRIRNTQIDAQREGDRRILDGEVMTACQAACPTRAITFGDLNDRDRAGRPVSQVARLQADSLNYGLLHDLNTRPRTTYLAALRNPNPLLPENWKA